MAGRKGVVSSGANVALSACDKELWHDFFKKYVCDSVMESATYLYHYDTVEKDFYAKTNDDTRLYFFILRDAEVVGQIYLKRMNKTKRTTEFGIALANDSVKGKGYGTEAIRLLLDRVFVEFAFERVLADTLLKNTRSQHILEKLGFVFLREDSGFRYYELKRCNYITCLFLEGNKS